MKYRMRTAYLARMALALCIVAFPGSAMADDDPKAREIMQKVEDRDDGDNGTSDMEMTLIDKNGDTRVRKMHSFSKDKGVDKQTIMFFLYPPDVKDTGFLTYDYDDPAKDDDQWLYLPALHKSKRIASSDKSGSFMGSDFNYSDMTSKEIENYDFKLMREMKVGDKQTWVIEVLPRSRKVIDETGYEKSLVFVRQDNYLVVRAVHYVNEGKRLKYLDVKELEQIDGIWVATEVHMTTKKGKSTLHKTILKLENVKFNQEVSEDLFTVRRLEKGL